MTRPPRRRATVSYAQSQPPFPAFIYEDPDTQRVLLFLTDKLAATVLEISTALQIDPERTVEILRKLESADLVRSSGTGLGPLSGIYSPAEPGVRLTRQIRSWKK